MEKQTLLQRGNTYPYIKIITKEFDNNIFRCTLKNISDFPAYHLGLLVNFVPCEISNNQYDFITNIAWRDEKDIAKYYIKKGVMPLKTQNSLARIYGKETANYEAECLFLFSSTKKFGKIGSSAKFDKYDELRHRLLGQNVKYVAVMLDLVYKDVQETINEFEEIGSFMVILNKHNNIQEAWDENIPFNQKTIGYEDIYGMEYDMYKGGKTYRGFLDDKYLN